MMHISEAAELAASRHSASHITMLKEEISRLVNRTLDTERL